MNIRKLSPELAKKAKDELFEDPQRIENDLKAIKEWIAQQPHLIARTDDQWLIAFLRGCKYSLERTKEKLDLFYTMRSLVPEITLPRDPRDPIVQEILSSGSFFTLPKTVNPDDPRISIIRGGKCDVNRVSIQDKLCVALMIASLQFLNDDQFVICGGIGIHDHKDSKLAHFTQLTPSMGKILAMCLQDAMPLRDKGGHYIHMIPALQSMFSVVKMFLKKKNISRIHVHKNMEAIYEYFSKDILPVEYGGNCGNVQDIIDYWKNEVENHRDWFLEDMKYKTDETKRAGIPKTTETLFGIEGSFRQLTVD